MLSVIIGRRRQGKSTLALSLAIAAARETEKSIIVFDPNNQYHSLPIIPDFDQWLQTATPAPGSPAIGRIVPIDPTGEFESMVAVLDGGRWVWGDYSLIVDECSMLMSPHKLHPALERYARTSPKDVDVILTTHRIVDVHPLFRALSTDWFLFQSHLPRDLELITDAFGADVATAAASLPPYHVLHYWLDSGGVPTNHVWSKPDEWFIDIGRIT